KDPKIIPARNEMGPTTCGMMTRMLCESWKTCKLKVEASNRQNPNFHRMELRFGSPRSFISSADSKDNIRRLDPARNMQVVAHWTCR
ncbi:hypothetical protein HAX54_030394, partial [Datura stramonium]|nr:hypothetical protein [Datura stramonium]